MKLSLKARIKMALEMFWKKCLETYCVWKGHEVAKKSYYDFQPKPVDPGEPHGVGHGCLHQCVRCESYVLYWVIEL